AADRDRPPEELAGELARAAENFFPAMVARRLAVRVEAYDGRRDYDERRPSFAQEVHPDELTPAYARMLRAYRDGKTVDRLCAAGEAASRTVVLAVPERIANGGHGEQVHHAVLLLAAAAGPDGEGRPTTANHLLTLRGPGRIVQRQSLQGTCLGANPVN